MSRKASARGGVRSLAASVAIPVVATGVLLAGACFVVLVSVKDRGVDKAGVNAARAVAEQIATLRTFYTEQVVARAKKNGLSVNYDFEKSDKTLPLPATLVKVLGEQIARDHPGTSVRLYSRYPFPHRAATEKYDAFETEAIGRLEKDPDTPVHRIERLDGRLSIRYAAADVMRESCVGCHNAHPESPKTNWRVGDVRGVVEVIVPVDDVERDLAASLDTTLGLLGVGFVGLLGAMLVLVRNRVARRVAVMRDAVGGVVEGDLAVALEDRRGTGNEVDELEGHLFELATVLRQFVGAARSVSGSIDTGVGDVRGALSKLEEGYASQRAAVTETVATLDELSAGGVATRDRANEVVAQAQETAAVSQEGTQAIASVGAGMSTIKSRVEEIARTVLDLSERSSLIGEVVDKVNAIAEQSKLLALNASIEASKAGEYGRGFAVVAAEVRELALGSQRATAEVRAILKQIQKATSSAVMATEEGSKSVDAGLVLVEKTRGTIATLEKTISLASRSVGEIARAVTEQSAGVTQINEAMRGIQGAVEEGTRSASSIGGHMTKLAERVRELTGVVSRFQTTSGSVRP